MNAPSDRPPIVCGVERINALECGAERVQYAPTEYLLAEDGTTLLTEAGAALLT
jgi:hypothetical protein